MKLLFAGAVCISTHSTIAQSADSLITSLWAIHNSIKSPACSNQQVISNRAMNIFLSDRIGYYMSSYKDLSLYKNSITFNSADGIFAINHNFFQAKGPDEPVRDFFLVGVKTNAANAFATTFSNKNFINELGVTIKKSWVSKPVTSLNNCFEKNLMDINREQQLTVLNQEIKKKETDFNSSLVAVKKESMPDSIFIKAKEERTNNFYTGLQQEYEWKFAEQQYRELALTQHFKTITLHWTNVSAYLPVLLQSFVSAESFAAAVANKRSYPVIINCII